MLERTFSLCRDFIMVPWRVPSKQKQLVADILVGNHIWRNQENDLRKELGNHLEPEHLRFGKANHRKIEEMIEH